MRCFFTVILSSVFTFLFMGSSLLWSHDSRANNRIKLPDIGNTSNIIISGEVGKKTRQSISSKHSPQHPSQQRPRN
jgi:hypothetical protein